MGEGLLSNSSILTKGLTIDMVNVIGLILIPSNQITVNPNFGPALIQFDMHAQRVHQAALISIVPLA